MEALRDKDYGIWVDINAKSVGCHSHMLLTN